MNLGGGSMQDIIIKIEAFGSVEKLLPADLNFKVFVNSLVVDVIDQLKQQYPTASEMIDRCACAIGDSIISRQDTLQKNCTLVLLSPVAGG